MTRPYVRVHEPLLIEYLNKHYPPGSWRTNVRLGMPHPELLERYVEPRMRRMLAIVTYRADAVVWLPDRVDILEVATEPEVKKVCQLKLYGHLFGVTEEQREHWGKPRRLILVSTITNPFIEWFAREEGVAWVVYVPIWWEEHVATRRARRFTAPSMAPPGGKEKA